MATRILTNKHWRDFVYRWDVPADVLEDQFSYMKETDLDTGESVWPDDEYTDGFFRYKNCWYHLGDFMRLPKGFAGDNSDEWHGYQGDSYFSGVLIRLSPDGEQYQVATYLS